MMKNKKTNLWMCCKSLYIIPVVFVALATYAKPNIPLIDGYLSNTYTEQIMQSKQKQKKLFGRGTRVPGTGLQFNPNQIGQEIGSAITIDRPTEIKEFTFNVLSCNIKDAVLGINIYSKEDESKVIGPILADVKQGKKQTIVLHPVESVVLEPGEYIVSIVFANCDEATKALWANSHQWDEEQRREMAKQSFLQLPFYVKGSYIRRDASDTFEKRNFNVGLQMKGVEY